MCNSHRYCIKIETVPVPIVDQNKQENSFTHLQIDRPYIALNSEIYISIRQQEFRTCKNIGYEFYCEEFLCFVAKHKSKYSCESAIYFDLGPDIIKKNCKFTFYFNNINKTPTVLNRGNEIFLVNWPDDKHICNVNNDIPVRIPSHPYVLVNRSILCNCGIKVENNFLLESLATGHNAGSNLIMHFSVNTAFVNYPDSLDNLTYSLKFPILLNKTTYKQFLPISLTSFGFDSELLKAPKTLKEFVHQFWHKK